MADIVKLDRRMNRMQISIFIWSAISGYQSLVFNSRAPTIGYQGHKMVDFNRSSRRS